MTLKFIKTLSLLVAAALPLLAQNRDTFNGREVAANQVIFKIKTSAAPATALQQLRQFTDADELRTLSSPLGLYLLHSRTSNVAALLAILRVSASVAYVEPDYIVKANTTPNDLNFSQQWSFLNTSVPGADIGATYAWDLSTGSTANVVGIVDTGIDYTHPDLAGNVWSAPSAFTVTLSWGQLTCPAGSHGYNAIARSCDPLDDHHHGTHVSGTVGASGNNALGVAGVNWTTRMMGLKFLDSTGSGSTSDAIDAIEFGMQAKAVFGAAANVRVLSNSWGGDGYSQALLDEINKTNTSDMLFVAAAGNSAQNLDTSPQYPAAFNAPNIISVAATTNSDGLASFSNWGKNTVHLGAPGVNILSTLPGSAYGYLSGTSMATPHVSGAAMLLLSKCSLTTAALKNTLLSSVDFVSSLSAITVTGGRLNVNKALRSCMGATGAPSGAASFVKADTTTSGTWKGIYGGEGSLIVSDTTAIPSYVTVTPSGNAPYTWAASTTDLRAPQKAAAADRVAACWYTSGTFSIDLNFSDQNSHQVALYLLDWDGYGGGRAERIDIVDTSNTLLNSQSVSGFANGRYLVWNLSGHVVLRITNGNASSNAVVSALLFGAGATTPPSANSAAFLKTDTATSGTWKGVYGADGSNVIGDTASYPAYAAVTPAGNSPWTWAASTADTRAPQKVSSTGRVAACWYTTGSMNLDVQFSDLNTHQVALYLLDFDNFARTVRVDVLDGATSAVLDTRSVTGMTGGLYLVWSLGGHVVIRVTNTNPASNAAISGLFFGDGGTAPPAGSAAVFVKTDIATAGTWKTVYGLDGSNIIGDATSYPAYVTVAPSGNSQYTWAANTSDTRALQMLSSADGRIAACWYTVGTMSLDLNFSDTNSHQVALYLLDFDNYRGRTERVDVVDAATNAILDTRSVSSFTGGQYLVWNMSGHVIVRVTNTNSLSNAVVSGVFFR